MSNKRDRRKREKNRRRPKVVAKASRSQPNPERALMLAASAAAVDTAEPYLQGDDLADKVVELADGTRRLALELIEQSPLAGKHACEAGCAFCCHTAVTVSPPELFAVADYLRKHYDESELTEVRKRLDDNAALAGSMTRDAYIAGNIPCALLTDDGRCRVHPVRPLCCAGFLSTSRAKCDAEFRRVVGRDPVPTDNHAMAAGLGVSFGLKEACQKAGRDGEFYELNHALSRVLDTPDAAEQWARGDPVLKGCPT